MFGKRYVSHLIARSASDPTDRRRFLAQAGAAGIGVAGAAILPSVLSSTPASADAATDEAVLNFALNLEYLEAEFYSMAVHGHGISEGLTHGSGKRGPVVGGHKTNFKSKNIKNFATEIAGDELNHVAFLRYALGSAAVSRPKIDLKHSFTAAARAAGVIKSNQEFDPFENDETFLLGAFLFEDVGVTAYKGAAPLIDNKTYLNAAAGILAVEAYHAGLVRTSLYDLGLQSVVKKLSDARDSLDGKKRDDQGIGNKNTSNIVPTNGHSIAFDRTTGAVLNIVYLTPKKADGGGFLPNGMNGAIYQSS